MLLKKLLSFTISVLRFRDQMTKTESLLFHQMRRADVGPHYISLTISATNLQISDERLYKSR